MKGIALWKANEPTKYDSLGKVDSLEVYLRGCSTFNIVKIARVAAEMSSHNSVNIMVGHNAETLMKCWEGGRLCKEEVGRFMKVQLRRPRGEEGEMRMHFFSLRRDVD